MTFSLKNTGTTYQQAWITSFISWSVG
jgi:hypothetical protein